jgi:hypothetical protein
MGLGEKTMKKWGYISSSFAIVLAFFTFILCILTIVVIKGNIAVSLKDNTVIMAIIVLLIAVATGAISIISIINIRKADELYLKVSSEAAVGNIPISRTSQGVEMVAPAPKFTTVPATIPAPPTNTAPQASQATNTNQNPADFMFL